MASDITTFAQNQPSIWAFDFHSNAWLLNVGVEHGAGDGFEVYPQGSPRTVTEPGENAAIFNNRVDRGRVVARKKVTGAYTCPWMFAGLQKQIAMWWGTEVTVIASGGSGYKHTITPAANSANIGNLAWTDTLVCHDIPCIKMQKTTFRCENGELGEVEFEPYGRRELIDGTGANTLATMANVTLHTQPGIKYVQNSSSILTFQMNASTGGSLAASDEYNLVGFELSCERVWRERFDSSGLPYPSEPVCGTALKFAGSFKFSLVADETGEVGTDEWLQIVDQTQMKATIDLVGSSIGGSPTDYWRQKFYLPRIQFDTSGLWQFNTPGSPDLTLPFTCSEESSTPTGFSYAYPYLEITDTRTTNWLS